MSEKVKFNQGDTDVKDNIIVYDTLETEDHNDDKETWNAMQPYGEDDREEMNYQSPNEASWEAKLMMRRANLGKGILREFDAKVA